MTNFYVIDTSSLVKLNRDNPLDVYPSVWRKLEGLIKKSRLSSPKEVFNEICRRDDHLTEWAKSHKELFVDATQKQIELVQKILSDYPSLINNDRPFDSDPWVIALAIEMSQSPQKTLVKIKRIVVTEEKLRGEKVRIPFVCEQLSVESIDIISVFREEGWQF